MESDAGSSTEGVVAGASGVTHTVTTHSAVLFPLTVVTVIVACPAPTAVTFPDESTVATVVSSVDHDTTLSVAFDGDMVAVSVDVSSLSSVSVLLLSDTLSTAILSVVIFVPALAALVL